MPTSQVRSSERLGLPIPEDCSVRFSEGWALADATISRGDRLLSPSAHDWDEEKARGYEARVRAETHAIA